MAFLEINPRYRDYLARHQLQTPAQFLALPGVVVSGHPERHVVRVQIGQGAETLTGYLKREHRISWRNRLANLCAGFGFSSRSRREACLLQGLHRAGVNCPELLAAGEDADGRAFVLVRAVPDAVDLRTFLDSAQGRSLERRRQLARALGAVLAHLHDTGFDHPDLYSKHVLVDAGGGIHIIDWQRSRQRSHLTWPRRWRDLAALHATLADELATPRDRLACLRAYFRATLYVRPPRRFWLAAVRRIFKQSQTLLRHRHIHEQRQPPLAAAEAQQLIWLDGEALCITPQCHAAWHGQRPTWLAATNRWPEAVQRPLRTTVAVPGLSPATLVHRRTHWRLGQIARWLCGRRITAPEVRQAGLLFRLQRYGIGTPRLLAFGQQHFPPWRTESFLLTEGPIRATDLASWLAGQSLTLPEKAVLQKRRQVLREAGGVLAALHAAGCYLKSPAVGHGLMVQRDSGAGASITIGNIEGLMQLQHSRFRARSNLSAWLTALPRQSCSRTDRLRFLLGYSGQRRLTPAVRRLGRLILQRRSLSDSLGDLLARFGHARQRRTLLTARSAG